MTDKQRQTLRDKIGKIKKTLAAEKKRFGGFDDSRGIRYVPTQLYVKLGDFEGGLRYLKWFDKNFPDDIGFPGFLFESAIILFKTNNLDNAKDKVLKTYFSNSFLLNKYFSRELKSPDKHLDSKIEGLDSLANFNYSHDQDDLLQFSGWLHEFMESDRFKNTVKEFDNIQMQLETEPVGQRRTMLVNRLFRMI